MTDPGSLTLGIITSIPGVLVFIHSYKMAPENVRTLAYDIQDASLKLKRLLISADNLEAGLDESANKFQLSIDVEAAARTIAKAKLELDHWANDLRVQGLRTRPHRIPKENVGAAFAAVGETHAALCHPSPVQKCASYTQVTSFLGFKFWDFGPRVRYILWGEGELVKIRDALRRCWDELDRAITKIQAVVDPNKLTTLAPDNTSRDLLSEFFIRARKRAKNGGPVEPIPPVRGPFEYTADKKSNIRMVGAEEGRYSGCILDKREVIRDRERTELQETERLVRLLGEDPDDFAGKTAQEAGLLICEGYLQRASRAEPRYLVFRLPQNSSSPRTLRSILTDTDVKHSLTSRAEFAKKLATSVLAMHSLGLVHKNIHPGSILIIRSKSSKDESLGSPYLFAFDQTRSDYTESGLPSNFDLILQKRLYRDPKHQQDSRRTEPYQMLDDIYSLGICLLEIGLWRSLFRWNEMKGDFVVEEDFSDEVLRDEGVRIDQVPSKRKEALIVLAKEKLPLTMGDKYRDVVVRCLECWENSGNEASVEKRKVGNNEPAIPLNAVSIRPNVAMKFDQEVIKALQDIHVHI